MNADEMRLLDEAKKLGIQVYGYDAANREYVTALGESVLKVAAAIATTPTSQPVHIGWICRDDLAQLLQHGSATVYQEEQEFRLLPPQPQYRVLVVASGVRVSDGGQR